MLKPTYKNNRFTQIEDGEHPTNFKQLLGFLSCNKGIDCFAKFQGNVWKIENGKWIKICRNISDLSYAEYLKLSLK